MFVRVLDALDVQVAPHNLLGIFIFLVEHAERVV